MVSSVWIIAAFLAGAAVGALLVTIQRVSALTRLREEFRTELERLTESTAESSTDDLVAPTTRRAA